VSACAIRLRRLALFPSHLLAGAIRLWRLALFPSHRFAAPRFAWGRCAFLLGNGVWRGRLGGRGSAVTAPAQVGRGEDGR